MRLHLIGLPPIDSLAEFAALTHLSKGFLFRLCRFSDSYYKVYMIAKNGGGQRLISQPSKAMKAVQSWILRNILDPLRVSPACKGFEKQVSIADNARPHAGSNAVLCIDIEEFFPSIRINQVWSVFRKIGYSPRIAASLASICCYKGHLPQGAPTSPKLANLLTFRLDSRILGYVGKKGIMYTRYADDLTFSGPSSARIIACLPLIRSMIVSEGFAINDKKTRLAGPGRAHRVTGLIVNDEDVGIGRKRFRKLRVDILSLCRYPRGKVPGQELARVEGWLAFVNGVDKKRYKTLTAYATRLKKKYAGTGVNDLRGLIP